ncbi:peroxisomal biogenesis factor 3 [Leptinotarsa decemlineata]|uniref:peroxisomal biogenesis factor 3 n=1 Tax=Leptinotarsa decemlineata TaxID=7539 RepID=UPI003D30BD81
MSVVSKFKGFFWRHKNKFIAGGALVTGTILLSKYAQKRLKEWQEKETAEFFDRSRKSSHFESIERTCNETVTNLSSALLDVINETINTDVLIESLRTNPENKLEIWNKLKVMVFTKAATIIYSIAMLVITLRIQLSIVGGYLFKDPNAVPTEIQEKYLSVCQNFLREGVIVLTKLVETEVKKCVEDLELTKQLKLSDIEAIFWTVQTNLATHKNSPVECFASYILRNSISDPADVYCNMIRDTEDFLDSDEIKSIATHCINRGFVSMGDQIAEFYNQNDLPTASNGQEDCFRNPFEIKKPIAKLIPIINGLLSKQSLPQHFVQQLALNEKLQILSANIYESSF